MRRTFQILTCCSPVFDKYDQNGTYVFLSEHHKIYSRKLEDENRRPFTITMGEKAYMCPL